MAEQKFTIDKFAPADAYTLSKAPNDLVVADGWGVFKVTDGLSTIFRSELESVWPKREEADEEAGRRNDQDGEIQYEVGEDPESNVYHNVCFDVGRVTLDNTEVLLVLSNTYRRVAEEQA